MLIIVFYWIIGLKLNETMNENELIQQLMSEYFYGITDENYLNKYNYLFDSVYGNHGGIADQLKRKNDFKYSDIANKISNELTEKTDEFK